MFTLYVLTFANGKRYIGQTNRKLNVRISQHRTAVRAGSPLPVHCAWRTMGEPHVSATEHASQEALHAAEIEAIADHATVVPGGYNLSAGGDTAPSKNPAVAAKIAEKAKGRGHTAETRARMAERSREKWGRPEYREKVGAGVKASWTEERRAAAAERIRQRNTGKRHSVETIAKMRARLVSEETRAKMSESAKQRIREPRSESHCASISAAVANSWTDPEIRARRSAAIRAGHARRKAAQAATKEQ